VGNKVLEFIIGAKDKTHAAATKAQAAFRRLGAAAKAGFSTMLRYSKIALGGLVALTAGIVVAIKAAMNIDAAKNPFIRFMGSAKAAKQHIKELQDIGEQGVVSSEALIDASRKLLNVSNGALGTSKNMKALADASTTVGEEIGTLTEKYGKFYLKLTLMEPIKREVQELQRLGVITDETSKKMIALEEAGYSQDKIWRLLQNDIHKFAGGVEDDAKLAKSSWDRLKETWKRDLEEIGGYFLDFASEKLDTITAWLKKMREDGSLQEWAEKVVKSLEDIAKAATTAIKAAKDVYEYFMGPDVETPKQIATRELKLYKHIPGYGGYDTITSEGNRKRQERIKELELQATQSLLTPEDQFAIGSGGRKSTKPSADVVKAVSEGFAASKAREKKLDKDIADARLTAAVELKKKQDAEIKLLEKKKDIIEKSNSLLQEQVRTTAELAREAADTATSESERARELALSSKARKELKAEEKQTAKEEQTLARLAERARHKIDRMNYTGFRRSLSEEEQYALKYEQQKKLAGEKMSEAEQLDTDAKNAAKDSAKRLENIDKNIGDLKKALESGGQ